MVILPKMVNIGGDNGASDLVGGHVTKSVGAVGLVAGKVGSGFHFGREGYLEVAQSPDLKNQQFTWIAWVRPDGLGPDATSFIVNHNLDANHSSVNLAWRSADQRFTFSGDGDDDLISSMDTFAPGGFYLVTATYDGAKFELWVDGKVEGSLDKTKSIAYSSYGWEIGGAASHLFGGLPHTWNGVIDEVQAYNRALFPMEVLTIFQAGEDGVCKGQVTTPANGPTTQVGELRQRYKDPAERDLYQRILKATNPRQQIHDLDTWAQRYPDSDYQDDRALLYLKAYDETKQPAKVLEIGNHLMSRGLRSLLLGGDQILAMLSTVCLNATALPTLTPSQLAVGEDAAHALQDFVPAFFTAANKPHAATESDWNLERRNMEKLSIDTLAFLANQRTREPEISRGQPTASDASQDSSTTHPDAYVDGALRRLTEKDLLLQTSKGRVIRFRLLAKTEFRGRDGKPLRDSLLHPGDRLTVNVSPDDIETAIYVILIRPGSSSEREAASVPVDQASIVAPDQSDFLATPSPTSITPDGHDRSSAPRDDSMDTIIADARAAASARPAQSGPGSMRPDGVYLPGNGVSPPSPVAMPGAESTAVARRLNARGEIDVSAVVQPDGTTASVTVSRSMGYGLDEKAIEAARKSRFKPCLKDGKAVPCLVGIGKTFALGPAGPDVWHSGVLAFAQEEGVAPPDVEDGTLPKPDGVLVNESAILEFVVDIRGAVKDIKSIQGSQSACEILTQSLSTWKFRPAMKGSHPVEAVGRVRFTAGQDERANYPVPAPLPQGNRSEPASSTRGATITPIDRAAVDDKSESINSNIRQILTMVNRKDGRVYVWIPPGAFTMGCSQNDKECIANEKPPHPG